MAAKERKCRYYVNEPMAVVPLRQYEALLDMLVEMKRLDKRNESEKKTLLRQYLYQLRLHRALISQARQHYRIDPLPPEITSDL